MLAGEALPLRSFDLAHASSNRQLTALGRRKRFFRRISVGYSDTGFLLALGASALFALHTEPAY